MREGEEAISEEKEEAKREDQETEQERIERRRKNREETIRKSAAGFLGNADFGYEVTAQGMFAASIYFFHAGGWLNYSLCFLFFIFSIFLAITKNQKKQGTIVKALRRKETVLSRDNNVGIFGYFSIAIGSHFAASEQYVACFYALANAVIFSVIKYRLPDSDITQFLQKSPEEIIGRFTGYKRK